MPGKKNGAVAGGPGRRRRAARQRRGEGGDALFGASEVTQARIALKPSYGPVVRISRSVGYSWTYDATATDRNFTVDWSLSDVPNAAELRAVWSQWRLRGAAITITWLPKDANALAAPRVYFGMDPFITTTLTFTTIMERPHRTWSPNPTRNVLQLTMRPRVVQLVATGPQTTATVGNAIAPAGLWYDCTNEAIAYGKMWVFMTGFADVGTFVVKQDYMFDFRGTR